MATSARSHPWMTSCWIQPRSHWEPIARSPMRSSARPALSRLAIAVAIGASGLAVAAARSARYRAPRTPRSTVARSSPAAPWRQRTAIGRCWRCGPSSTRSCAGRSRCWSTAVSPASRTLRPGRRPARPADPERAVTPVPILTHVLTASGGLRPSTQPPGLRPAPLMTPLPRTRVVKMPAHRATVIGKLVPPAAVPPHSVADGMRPVVPGRVARRTRCSPATAVMRPSPPGTAGTIRRCTRSGEARRSRAPVVRPRRGVLGVLRGTVHLVMGTMATVLFFGSIIARELSRTLRALREGVQRQRDHSLAVRRRVSRRRAGPPPAPNSGWSPPDRWRPGAGPGLLGLAVVARASGWPDGVVGVPDHVARNNGLLLAFNMVPALPLDGGRLPQPSAATKGPRRWKRCDA